MLRLFAPAKTDILGFFSAVAKDSVTHSGVRRTSTPYILGWREARTLAIVERLSQIGGALRTDNPVDLCIGQARDGRPDPSGEKQRPGRKRTRKTPRPPRGILSLTVTTPRTAGQRRTRAITQRCSQTAISAETTSHRLCDRPISPRGHLLPGARADREAGAPFWWRQWPAGRWATRPLLVHPFCGPFRTEPLRAKPFVIDLDPASGRSCRPSEPLRPIRHMAARRSFDAVRPGTGHAWFAASLAWPVTKGRSG